MIAAASLARLYLYAWPEGGGVTLFGAHLHHLMTGVILVVIGGIPAVLVRSNTPIHAVSVCVFGFGLGLALDEWVLMLVREQARETAYLSRISLTGALVLLSVATGYALLICALAGRERDDGSGKTRNRERTGE